jgi:1-acyl-sn-glycerol-3-phosphate acyltransferase
VFKRELLFVPFFGWTMGMLKMVHIDRRQGKDAFASVARQGRERMAEGAWVIMFPEGTRTAWASKASTSQAVRASRARRVHRSSLLPTTPDTYGRGNRFSNMRV